MVFGGAVRLSLYRKKAWFNNLNKNEMGKKVLILSSSPRKGGNSDLLCDEFFKGAREAGNDVEKIFLKDKRINYCTGCSVCSMYGKPCPQKDDAAEIIGKMIAADDFFFWELDANGASRTHYWICNIREHLLESG